MRRAQVSVCSFQLTSAVFVYAFVVEAEVAREHNLIEQKSAEPLVCLDYEIFVVETEHLLHHIHHRRGHLIKSAAFQRACVSLLFGCRESLAQHVVIV